MPSTASLGYILIVCLCVFACTCMSTCVCVCVHAWPNQSRLFACLLPWRGCVFVVEMWRCREWTVTRAISGRRPLIRTELLLHFTYRAHTHTEADGHTPAQIAGISLLASRGFLATCARACLGAWATACVVSCVCMCVSVRAYVGIYVLLLKCICAYMQVCVCVIRAASGPFRPGDCCVSAAEGPELRLWWLGRDKQQQQPGDGTMTKQGNGTHTFITAKLLRLLKWVWGSFEVAINWFGSE